MMKNSILSPAALGLAAVFVLAGCSGSTGNNPMPGMTGGMAHSSSQPAGQSAAAGEHNAADTMFAQGMIPHHTQAVEMSDTILQKQGVDPRVAALATRIKAAQAPEIETMTGWLRAWNEPSQMASGHGMGDGMMGDEDLKGLGSSQGADAARLFLSQMIAHHGGAVTMAKNEIGQGKNPEALTLARSVVSSQEAEIKEMKSLLSAL